MIDFGKATKLPEGMEIDHKTAWERGNHEDGYLTGLNSMISIMEDLLNRKPTRNSLTPSQSDLEPL